MGNRTGRASPGRFIRSSVSCPQMKPNQAGSPAQSGHRAPGGNCERIKVAAASHAIPSEPASFAGIHLMMPRWIVGHGAKKLVTPYTPGESRDLGYNFA